jgi:hypothetical protein
MTKIIVNRSAPIRSFCLLHCSPIKSTLPCGVAHIHTLQSAYRGLAMPQSWLSDEWFLCIMDIIFWIPALGIARLTLVLSPLITIRATNEGHYAYRCSNEAETRYTRTRSLIYALALGPVDSNTRVWPVNTWGHLTPTSSVGFGHNSALHALER